MTATQIRFLTLWRREINRFMKIKKQTIGAPLLETFLYISVFGAALGSRIDKLHGIDYVVFVIPGLIMMAWSTNAFARSTFGSRTLTPRNATPSLLSSSYALTSPGISARHGAHQEPQKLRTTGRPR